MITPQINSLKNKKPDAIYIRRLPALRLELRRF